MLPRLLQLIKRLFVVINKTLPKNKSGWNMVANEIVTKPLPGQQTSFFVCR